MLIKRLLKISTPKIKEEDIDFEVNQVELTNLTGENIHSYTINIKYLGEYSGYLIFSFYTEDKMIHIEHIEVDENFRNLGLAQYMYKKFGEIYNEKFNGFNITRDFQNPIAEQAYLQAIQLGWVPKETFNEQYITRTY